MGQTMESLAKVSDNRNGKKNKINKKEITQKGRTDKVWLLLE